MVTIMSPDGKPVQVSASSLQAAGLQNQNGIYHNKKETKNCPKIVNKSKGAFDLGIQVTKKSAIAIYLLLLRYVLHNIKINKHKTVLKSFR